MALNQTNQGLRHASFYTIAGISSGTYNGAFMRAMAAEGATADTFNGRLIEWLQIRLESTDTNLNNLKAAFAADYGVTKWDEVGAIEALP